MSRTTVEEVPSLSYRVLEWTILGPIVATGVLVAAVGVLTTAGAWTLLEVGWWLFLYGGAGLGLFVAVATPVALYLDAQRLNREDLGWEPNPGLFALLGVVLGWVVTVYYLYRRHLVVIDWEGRRWWWVVGVGGVVLGVGGLLAPSVLSAAGVPVPATVTFPGQAVSLGILVGAVPLAFYRDATYVRLKNDAWRPNPVIHLLLPLCGVVLALVPALAYLAYYCVRRHSALGTP